MKKIATLASLALLGICSATSAAEFWTPSASDSGWLTWSGFDSSGSTPVNVTSYSYRGGQFAGFFNTDGTSNDDEFFRFFCIDLAQYANTSPQTYGRSILDNDAPADALARLFDIAYPNKEVGDFYNNGRTKFGQFSSDDSFSEAVYSSAFQLAVWEIYFEAESTFDLTKGTFKSNIASGAGSYAGQAVAKATEWLTDINNKEGSAAGWTLYKFSNGSYQDYLSATYAKVPEQTDNSVPEPGTLAMLGLGIAALGAIRRRRR